MKKRPIRDEAGQVIVEFVIVFTMILTLIFLFVQMSWGIAWGHYTHYATYMAARAYLAAGATKGDQYNAASAVLSSMLKTGGKDLFPFLSPARTGGDRDASGSEPVPGAMVGYHPTAADHPHSRLYSWAEGVQYNFNLKMFLLPISTFIAKSGTGQNIHTGVGGGGKAVEFKGMIPFTSDSFLGRESSEAECFEFMDRLSSSMGINRMDNAVFIEDNGC